MEFEGLLILLGISYLLLPFYLLFSLNHLKKRVDELAAGKISKKKPQPELYIENGKEVEAETPTSDSSNPIDDFMHWLKVDWPMKTGAFLILLAFGWLTTYAFMNNWIGPVGRISMGIGGGLLILILGEWRNGKSIPQGSVLQALGGGTILVSVFAARTVYDFFTPSLALLFMGLVVVFLGVSSVKHRTLPLAALSLAMGAAAPFLIDSPEPNFIGLFSYLFVLCAGTLWVVGITGWRVLNNLALAIVAIFSFLQIEELGLSAPWIELGFAFAFALLFLASNFARIFKNKNLENWDIVNSIGNGAFLLYWIHSASPEEWKSLVTVDGILIFFFAALFLFKRTALKEVLYIYGGLAFIFLAAATRFEIKEDVLFFILYTLEACAGLAGVYFTLRDVRTVRNLSIVLVLPAFLSLESLGATSWMNGIFHLDSLLVVLMAVSGLSLGGFLRKNKDDSSTLPLVVGLLYSMAWIWLASGALIANDAMAVLTALSIYTVAGLIMNIVGNLRDKAFFRNAGAVFIGLVVLRLLAVDIWEMAISGKIITFFVIGSLLIGTAFISKKHSK